MSAGIRPFILGQSGRVAAHVLDYVPSPANVVYSPGYGRQPLWCKYSRSLCIFSKKLAESGCTDCSKGCCHAPHMCARPSLPPFRLFLFDGAASSALLSVLLSLSSRVCRYEEWWIGPPSGNPTEMTEWRRPYRDTKMAPHDIWLMAQPVTTESAHVWVDNGVVWGLPIYRLAGVYSPGNGEFSTAAFPMPEKPLWINAECVSERPAEQIMPTLS